MNVYFLRHGVAFEREDWDGDNDDLRPLTKDGKQAMKREAKRMRKWELPFDCIVTSPLVRAYSTAKITAKAMNLSFAVDNLLKPGFDKAALQKLQTVYPQARNLVIVGHEPDFSTVIADLTGGRVEMKKGGLACVEIASENPLQGRLLWLLTPEQLGG
jgi:phosphohistidine phosphatase